MRKYVYISVLMAILLAYLLPFQFLLNFAHDDSFFYIKTASNFSKGLGSTFDGINITNGYHPLYFVSLVILFFIPNFLFKTSPEFLYRLVVLYHLFMIIGIQYFVIRSLKNIFKKETGYISLLLISVLFASFIFIRDFGLESHLACMLVSFFLYTKSKELITGENNIYIRIIILILLFLTRTDYLYTIIPFILIADCSISTGRKKYFILSVVYLFSAAILYYFSNYLFFGYIDTVSGKILNNFPGVLFSSNINTLLTDPAKFYNQFARIIIVLVSLILFTCYYYINRQKESNISKFYLLVLGLGTGSMVFTLMHLLFNNYGIREWYMTMPVMVSIIMVLLIIRKRKSIIYISLILSVILLFYVFYGSRVQNYKYVSGYEYAKKLYSVLSEQESVYQVDYCGVVGFFSNRSVIDGDGLINSYEYLNYLKSGRIDNFISKYNIKYYSTYSTDNLLKDSVYIDENFSDKVNGKRFSFQKSSLITVQPFIWNHIAFDLKGNWYLFKFK
jgi:hypothetical protein